MELLRRKFSESCVFLRETCLSEISEGFFKYLHEFSKLQTLSRTLWV